MSAVTAALSSSSTLIAALADNASPALPASVAPGATDASADSDRGPATSVQLSDTVKATLAKAKTDQVAADTLQNFVATHRAGGSNSAQSASDGAKIDSAFAQLSGADTTTTGDATTPQPVQVVRSFSTGLVSDGYTVAAVANGNTGSSSIEIMGPDGFSFFDKHFGWSDEASGGSGIGPGMSMQEVQSGNVEYITLSHNEASAANVTTTSGGTTASASTASAQSDSVTIAVDFTTGAVSLTQSQASLSSATASVGQAKSPLSILA